MSAGEDAFRAAVAELGRIQSDIVAASCSDHDGWRRDLIALRRTLQAQMTMLSQLIDGGDVDTPAELREALNRMRSKVALHQANWPAVAIDRDHPDYRASVQNVRDANAEFIAVAGRTPPPSRPTDQ